MIDILNDISANRSDVYLRNTHTNMPLISTVISALINVAKEFGDLKKTYYVECDMAIADYAGKNNALAVIGDDTDFIIFEGNWKFWSASDMDMQNITTIWSIIKLDFVNILICPINKCHFLLLCMEETI